MIYSITLNEYNKHLESGLKKLNSYNRGFENISLISFIVFLIVFSYFSISIANGIVGDLTLVSFGKAVAGGQNEILGYVSAGALALVAVFKRIHNYTAKKQIESYLTKIHPFVLASHKEIFKSQSPEFIELISNEVEKENLLIFLKTYSENIKFVINNHDDLSVEQ